MSYSFHLKYDRCVTMKIRVSSQWFSVDFTEGWDMRISCDKDETWESHVRSLVLSSCVHRDGSCKNALRTGMVHARMHYLHCITGFGNDCSWKYTFFVKPEIRVLELSLAWEQPPWRWNYLASNFRNHLSEQFSPLLFLALLVMKNACFTRIAYQACIFCEKWQIMHRGVRVDTKLWKIEFRVRFG